MLKPLVLLLSYLVGAILIVAGILAIGAYVRSAIAVWGSSDQSVLYWYLFLPFIGAWLVAIGVYFVWLARAASHEGSTALTQAKRSLAVFGIATATLAVAGHFRLKHNEEAGQILDRASSLHSDRGRNASKLAQIRVEFPDNEEMMIHARLSNGLDGTYRWSLKVLSERAVLSETSQVLDLRNAPASIDSRITFAQLFAPCFAANPPPDAYVCVRNAGTNESYTVQGQLELVDDGRGAITPGERRFNPIVSSASVEFRLDAFTTAQTVVVKHAELDPPP